MHIARRHREARPACSRTPSGVQGLVERGEGEGWKGVRVSPRGKREFKHGGVVGGVGDGGVGIEGGFI